MAAPTLEDVSAQRGLAPSAPQAGMSGPASPGLAAGMGAGAGWPGACGMGLAEKREGAGNKRSGASRRRKAKMYQSLNAMVQVRSETGGCLPAVPLVCGARLCDDRAVLG